MEKNYLEKIINEIKLLDGVNYSPDIEKKLYSTYYKSGDKAALDFVRNLLEEKAEAIFTLNNLRTISGNTKIVNYVSLYHEIETIRDFYKNK